MINNNISYYLTLTFLVRALRGELHGFWGTWLRCNSLEWNGAPKRRPRSPAQRGSGSAGDAAIALHTQGGARIPLRGRTFLRKALLRPARSHSASLRLALHPKNRTLHPRPTTGFRLNLAMRGIHALSCA
ncbi:hypothetical protein NNRS527_02438 [Nitrosospira sp. NRS527]|nr:hypothetical protein NNRS527_02438 [Nitrosospira sp. NRS527]